MLRSKRIGGERCRALRGICQDFGFRISGLGYRAYKV